MNEPTPTFPVVQKTMRNNADPSHGKEPRRKVQARASQACRMCKLKKSKCDERTPCKQCAVHNWQCIYEPNARSGPSNHMGGSVGHKSNIPARVELPQTSSSTDAQRPRQIAAVGEPFMATFDEDAWSESISSKRLKGGHQGTPSGLSDSQQDVRPLGDINERTNGTEYYGGSSNVALLDQLFAHARSKLLDGSASIKPLPLQDHREVAEKSGAAEKNAYALDPPATQKEGQLNTSRMSIVNLLYDDYLSSDYDSSPKTPSGTSRSYGGSAAHPSGISILETSPVMTPLRDNHISRMEEGSVEDFQKFNGSSVAQQAHRKNTTSTLSSTEIFGRGRTELLMEQEYARLFFANLYYIHPFLSKGSFMQQCEKDIWSSWPLSRVSKCQTHFMALYNVVLAVGSLTSNIDIFSDFQRQLSERSDDSHSDALDTTSSMQLSKVYFQRSKRFLGDCFEASSLEGAQTLVLMSLYCQNALRPHACYMYSGMAVRTALAIGLPEESMSQSLDTLNSARKTWWAIYSQEIDMCCSSGRISGLMSPDCYSMSLPEIDGRNSTSPDINASYISIIPEMVSFAALLLRASKEIYFDSKHRSISEKSKIAFDLDECFTDWRRNLPSWLQMDSNPLREAEWVGKQRVVLELRYHNAKILLHRPFVAESNLHTSELGRNVEACLSAARATIHLLYNSYLHRYYFRTWRYNCTYTVYAATIVLYLILLDYTAVPARDLISDVQKSLEILSSMEEAPVVRRCANLVRELFGVASEHVRQRQANLQFLESEQHLAEAPDGQVSSRDMFVNSSLPDLRLSQQESFRIQSALDILEPSFGFSNNGGTATSMNEMWTYMMDPVTLEPGAIGGDDGGGFSFDSPWMMDEPSSLPPN